eukprot:SAG31_NODE_977_length_10615_cov_93.546786_5_plen_53_part_00
MPTVLPYEYENDHTSTIIGNATKGFERGVYLAGYFLVPLGLLLHLIECIVER